MHVLWFSGVELPAVTGGNLTRAGWQEGLRRALFQHCPEIQLSIASFGPEPFPPFQVENATYYHINKSPLPQGRLQRIWNNWQHNPFTKEDLERSLLVYQQVKPDLVFIFGTENPFGLLANRISVPVIISIQAVINGLVGSLFQGLSFRELIREFFSRRTFAGDGIYHKWWSHHRSARIERRIYQQVQYFCGRTNWDRSWQERLNPNATYFHIDRVLREDFYKSVWEQDLSDTTRIFSLSGNAPFKGGKSLVQAMALLKDRGYGNLQLHLAGIDSDSLVGQAIARVIREADLQGQVHLLGRLPQTRIIKEMQEAGLFVLPSHLDNSPNSLAEAMIMGMPCIASNAGGIPSMLQDGKEGLIYPHQDLRSLADKIEILLSDLGLAKRLGQTARQTALSRHDPATIARTTTEVYQQVLREWDKE